MSGHSDGDLRRKIMGLGERSPSKSYYPELRRRLEQLEQQKAELEENNRALQRLMTQIEQERSKAAANEAELRALVSSMTDVVLVVDSEGRYLRIPETNPSLLYKPPVELVGKALHDVFPKAQADEFLGYVRQALQTRAPVAAEYSLPIGDKQMWFSATLSPMSEDSVVLVARDITERVQAEEQRRRLENQLIQAQRMESVGRLAGGIAHDFNNMLTPIMGYAELLRVELAKDDPRRGGVEQIIRAAERSRDLVRQLLAFARRQTLEMKPVDLNRVLSAFERMLRRTLHENITLELRLAPSLGSIRADIGQLEQIVMNLAVNAQDAMPQGGSIFLETSETQMTEEDAATQEGGITPGPYVVMSVSDTGAGMDKETVERIFEPFYTTKKEGKGVGLGLATVYGIVKQHGGHIQVYSEPGYGSLFRVYFPRSEDSVVVAKPAAEFLRPLGGSETILVVEDQEQVRALAVDVLQRSGYTVLQAAGMKEAIAAAVSFEGGIDLLVADVILVDGNGRALYEALVAQRPSLRVLFMSGYTADVIGYHGVLQEGVNLIQKPFSLAAFTRKVRDVLEAGG